MSDKLGEAEVGGLSSRTPFGKFLIADKARIGAYVKAGGRVEARPDGALFFRDATIVNRVVDGIERAEAERIRADEGWGAAFTCIPEEIETDEVGCVPTPAEHARGLKILSALEIADPTEAAPLESELLEIERVAILRTCIPARRAQLGVAARVGLEGTIQVTRGIFVLN